MLRLDPAARNVIGLHQSGQYQTQVVRQLNVHQSTISRIWRRLNQTGSAQERSISGRTHITTPAQDQYIRVFHLHNRYSHCYSHCCKYAMFTDNFRQREMFQQDKARHHTARVTIDFHLRTTLLYCHDPQCRPI